VDVDEKACRICGITKPLTAFHRATAMRDGHRNECKDCFRQLAAARYRANPQATIDRVRRWQAENPERVKASRRRRRQDSEVKQRDRAGHLRRKFGITTEQYDTMLAAQQGGCAICGRTPRTGSSLHVDHDHATGAVRALLCFSCNAAIGHLRDEAERVERVLRYLTSHDREAVAMTRAARERVLALRR
jgi:hypothetical protein